ncbi:hypothetical protein TRFO_41031 [Tritrichomonas foetus]|uniref:Uncharacterized protein n=1 Tax=Tritrichomonas foetus TaxID=1144522 RepID=A0A1J4L614_9EUKA|nr:hypothetical protein TRFO_41031 [Tritrichomonas foetus]|eukprot:OHT17390.1 hypothetical protein TRFO_41031 [Tritrichomonas foetus]
MNLGMMNFKQMFSIYFKKNSFHIEEGVKSFLSHSNNCSFIVTSENITLKDFFQHAKLIPPDQKFNVITTLASYDETIKSLQEDLRSIAKNSFVFYNITEYNVCKLNQNIPLIDTILDINNDQIQKILFGEVYCHFSIESLESFLIHNLVPVTTKSKIKEIIEKYQNQCPLKIIAHNIVLQHQNEILSSLENYYSIQSTIEKSEFDYLFDVVLNMYFCLKFGSIDPSEELPRFFSQCHDNVMSLLRLFYDADEMLEIFTQNENYDINQYEESLKYKLKNMIEEWINFSKIYSNNTTNPIPEEIIELMNYLVNLYDSYIGKNNLDPQIIIKVDKSECFIRILHPRSTIFDSISKNDKRIFVFGGNLSILEEFDFDVSKYTRISNKMIKGLSKVFNDELIFSYINILLNPDNEMFNYQNEWNENSQNEVLQNISYLVTGHMALSVLRYYPIFYNGLQKYCLKPQNKKYLSVFGSPGTGKSKMLIYFIHRWYHKNDLWNGCTANRIQSILIKSPSRAGNYFFYIERVNDDIIRFGKFMPQNMEQIYQIVCSSTEIANQSEDEQHYEIEISQLFQFSKKDNKISYVTPVLSPDKYKFQLNENTLIILDEYEKCFDSPMHKLLILNSIGAKHNSEKENELTVYTFLPKKDEMAQIQMNLKPRYAPSFLQLNEYIGKNIRKCCQLDFSEDFINTFDQIINNLSTPDLEFIHLQPLQYLFSNKKSIRSLIIQVDSIHPEDDNLKYYSRCSLHEFSRMFFMYTANLSSIHVYQRLYEIWQKNNLHRRISLGVSDYFNSGNKNLCGINWKSFIHDLFKEKKLFEIDFQQFYYTYNKKLALDLKEKKENGITNILFIRPIEKNTEEEKGYYKFNPKSFEPVVTNNLNELISSKSNYIYFHPSFSNHPGFDSVIKIKEKAKKGKVTHLFILKITVSNQYSFHMDAFEKIINNEKTKNWQIEFWIVSPQFTDFRVHKIKRNRKKRDQAYPTKAEDEQNFCTYTSNYPFVVVVPRIR